MSFFSAFKIFFLSLGFKILIMLCLGMDFFRFILLEFHSALRVCRFISHAKFGAFSAIISLGTFSASLPRIPIA